MIAVDMPNQQGIRSVNWKSYRTLVDQIESWTGYNFLSNCSAGLCQSRGVVAGAKNESMSRLVTIVPAG